MADTIILYFFICFGSVMTAYCVLCTKTRFTEKAFRFALFLIMFVPAILRYNIGHDYREYVRLFNYNLFKGYSEPGFNFIVDIIKFFGGSAWWMFFWIAAFTYIFIIFCCEKELLFPIILYYFLYGAYLRSYDQIRSSLAFSIILNALFLQERKEYKKAVIVILLASLMHRTALVFLLLMPLSEMRIKKQWKVFLTILITALLSTINYIPILVKILQPIFPRYAMLASITTSSEGGTGLGILLKIFFPLAIAILSNNSEDRIANIEANYCLFYVILSIATIRMDILNRLRDVVAVGVLFSFTNPQYGKYQVNKKYFNYFVIVIGIVLYFHDILNGVGPNTNGIAPYQSIFSATYY